jgi:hypothetical protein
LHEEDAGEDGNTGPLVERLCTDGYRVASTEHDRARTVVLAAARLTGNDLPSSYYVGRDLLALGDGHLRTRPRRDANAAVLARAVDRLSTNDPAGAYALLLACDATQPDVAGTLGATLVALERHAEAITALEVAISGDPSWPLHHWNLAVAMHALADHAGTHAALCRFVATSALPSGLYGDALQPERVARAERMIAELERTARLTGMPLSLRRRRRKARR